MSRISNNRSPNKGDDDDAIVLSDKDFMFSSNSSVLARVRMGHLQHFETSSDDLSNGKADYNGVNRFDRSNQRPIVASDDAYIYGAVPSSSDISHETDHYTSSASAISERSDSFELGPGLVVEDNREHRAQDMRQEFNPYARPMQGLPFGRESRDFVAHRPFAPTPFGGAEAIRVPYNTRTGPSFEAIRETSNGRGYGGQFETRFAGQSWSQYRPDALREHEAQACPYPPAEGRFGRFEFPAHRRGQQSSPPVFEPMYGDPGMVVRGGRGGDSEHHRAYHDDNGGGFRGHGGLGMHGQGQGGHRPEFHSAYGERYSHNEGGASDWGGGGTAAPAWPGGAGARKRGGGDDAQHIEEFSLGPGLPACPDPGPAAYRGKRGRHEF